MIIVGIVLTIIITSAFVLNYHIDEEIKSQKFRDEQIDRIFKRCDYQKMMDDRNWIDSDGNKGLDHQPLYFWNNSTHHIDNNTCKWQTIEQYESDTELRDALARCWIGNSEFIDDDFILWSNETHYVDNNTCELELISGKTVTGSYELEEASCIGGRGMIKNENCEIIGKYDPATGMPIVENKEQCNMLEGNWDEEQKICDSKYGGQ